ncbi:CRISPR-associated helicase Cas3' [Streptomyces sp. O3]
MLWGKSAEKAGGKKNLLLSHMLDTAAVAECMWDGFLAPSTRRLLDEAAGGPGRGRAFFAWLCGVHDIGKATPAFQRLWPLGAAEVRAAGLTWSEAAITNVKWRHDRAGGFVLRGLLRDAGWPDEQVDWVWPLVAGHHGRVPTAGSLRPSPKGRKQLEGDAKWAEARQALTARLSEELGFSGARETAPTRVPTRAAQLHLSGLIVMADWIASDERHFTGVDELGKVGLAAARGRAARAWKALGLRGGWGRLAEPGPTAFSERFGHEPRASQSMVLEAARGMEAPGLLVVEAPMGEGKTKAALLAAEILAARFGADGVFVGMPTQATCDPMFTQTRRWVGALDTELASQVALLHGKRMFNKEWKKLLDGEGGVDEWFGGVDEYGDCLADDPYHSPGAVGDSTPRHVHLGASGPATWYLGAKRGLLCPFVVGTIDQLLYAATRSKHVMLRMAGLAGKVVVLDEVHAADVYMSQFLKEALRWLGQAGVPVVLLSATLPPAQRKELVDAYLAGAGAGMGMGADANGGDTPDVPMDLPGYPHVTAASVGPDDGRPQIASAQCRSWRDDLNVAVRLLPEPVPEPGAEPEERQKKQDLADASVTAYLRSELAEGGCALVIRNTVGRAQSLYQRLRAEFEGDVRLLHGRIAVGDRADRTEACLRLLGPGGREGEQHEQYEQHERRARPRLVVVATQLAEQSFDADADLLVTDIAPVDLLLQRIGRLHRHDGVLRPDRLASPQVVITGFASAEEAQATPRALHDGADAVLDGPPPRFLPASVFLYGDFLLLRAAALVREAAQAGEGWAIPSQVPALVATGYRDDESAVPPKWRDAEHEARQTWESEQAERADKASPFLLTSRADIGASTLAGLHYASGASGEDPGLELMVRDGEQSAEVVLVRHQGGVYRTLKGRALTANGDVSEDLLDDVLAGTVRLPSQYTKGAEELPPLPGWIGHPRLRYCSALVLDEQSSASLADRRLRYDDELGVVELKV